MHRYSIYYIDKFDEIYYTMSFLDSGIYFYSNIKTWPVAGNLTIF